MRVGWVAEWRRSVARRCSSETRSFGRCLGRLTRVAADDGSTVIVSGVAGIGKTSLLSVVADEARRRGFGVLSARGADLERTFAFGVVRSLLEPALRRAPDVERARLLSGAAQPAAVALGLDASPGASVDASPALLNAIYWIADGLTRTRPTVMLVDDAHWADGPSLRALAFVAHRIDALALALVLGVRDAEPSADDAAFDAIQAQAVRIPLHGLSADGVRAMLERRLGEVSAATVDAVHLATGGTPFWIEQAAAAAARGAPRPGEAWSEQALTAVVRGRLAGTSAAARAVAKAVAVLGNDPELRHAAALANLEVEEVLGAAGELEAIGIFASSTAIEFAHPSLAEAVVSDTGPHDLSLAHLRAARILRATGAPPERSAGHLLRAAPTGEPENVDDLVAAAADALRRGSPVTATELLVRARAEPPTPDQDRAVRALLGMSDLRLGRFADAAAHLAVAAEDPGADVELVLSLAFARGFAGQAGSLVGQLLDAAARQSDAERRLVLDSLAAYWSWWIPIDERPSIPLPAIAALAGATRGERLALAAHVLHLSCASDLGNAADVACRLLRDGRTASDGAAFTNPAGIGLVTLNAAERYADFDRDIVHVAALAHASAAADAIYLLDLVRLQRYGQCGDLAAVIETSARMARFAAAAPGAGHDMILLAATGWLMDAVLEHEDRGGRPRPGRASPARRLAARARHGCPVPPGAAGTAPACVRAHAEGARRRRVPRRLHRRARRLSIAGEVGPRAPVRSRRRRRRDRRSRGRRGVPRARTGTRGAGAHRGRATRCRAHRSSQRHRAARAGARASRRRPAASRARSCLHRPRPGASTPRTPHRRSRRARARGRSRVCMSSGATARARARRARGSLARARAGWRSAASSRSRRPNGEPPTSRRGLRPIARSPSSCSSR